MKKSKPPRGRKAEEGKASKLLKYIPVVISALSLVISFLALRTSYESRPLAYYAVPTITAVEGNTILWDLEMIVTSGAIGNVRIIDYRNGQAATVANNVGGVIREGAGKAQRTFSFRLEHQPQEQSAFYATEYILVHGKDGSKSIGMILFHLNPLAGQYQVRYYSAEDLLFAEMDPSQTIYAGALASYRELLELLRQSGEL